MLDTADIVRDGDVTTRSCDAAQELKSESCPSSLYGVPDEWREYASETADLPASAPYETYVT